MSHDPHPFDLSEEDTTLATGSSPSAGVFRAEVESIAAYYRTITPSNDLAAARFCFCIAEYFDDKAEGQGIGPEDAVETMACIEAALFAANLGQEFLSDENKMFLNNGGLARLFVMIAQETSGTGNLHAWPDRLRNPKELAMPQYPDWPARFGIRGDNGGHLLWDLSKGGLQ